MTLWALRDSSTALVRKKPRSYLAVLATATLLLIVWLVGAPMSVQALSEGSAKQLLASGIKQYKTGHYEQAAQTLGSLNREDLGGWDKGKFDRLVSRVQTAVQQSRAARAEFDAGETALAAGNLAEAKTRFTRTRSSTFVDRALRDKAAARLALVDKKVQINANRIKQLFAQSVKQFNDGDYADARRGFQQVNESGVDLGMFDRDKPKQYLQRIAKVEADRGMLADSGATTRVASSGQPAAGSAVAVPVPIEVQVEPQPADTNRVSIEDDLALQQDISGTSKDATGSIVDAEIPNVPEADDEAALKAAEISNIAAAQQGEAAAPVAAQPAETQQVQTPQIDQTKISTATPEWDDAVAIPVERPETLATGGPARTGPYSTSSAESVAQPYVRASMPEGLMMKEMQKRRILSQRAMAEYSHALKAAREALAGQQYNRANDQVNHARNVIEAHRHYLSRDQYATLMGDAEQLEKQINEGADTFRVSQIKKKVDDARVHQAKNQLIMMREKQKKIDQLFELSRSLRDQQKYEQAHSAAEELLLIDPTLTEAQFLREDLFDRLMFQRDHTQQHDSDRAEREALQDIRESEIPWWDLVRYPKNWEDITNTRTGFSVVGNENPIDREVRSKLKQKVPDIDLRQATFEQAIDFLTEVNDTNIFVNWKALEAVDINREDPVSTRLRDVSFEKVLNVLLADVSGGNIDAALEYTLEDGVITISTREDLAQNPSTHVYDIRDLIIRIPSFSEAPEFSLSQATQSSSGGGGGGNIFEDSADDDEADISRQELVESVLLLITETVDNESWRDNGGDVGSVREHNGQLIVTQTLANHQTIADLLAQLRETRALQIAIEARFIAVENNFLEDIGLDLDFVFNARDPDAIIFDPETGQVVSVNSFASRTSQIAGPQGSYGAARPPTTRFSNSLGGALGPNALTIAGQFLDAIQVDFLIRATEANRSSRVMTAPRITLFNGQRAFITVATQRAYVSDLTPAVAEGVATFDPEVDVISEGVVLDVEATISADRRYVTLTLRPSVAVIDDIFEFTFASAAIPAVENQAGIAAAPGVASGTVQQPVLTITQLQTSVSVPDGGTLLIGGQKISDEIEIEVGVPLLSKIPVINRAFTNRSKVRDERTLLILVRPQIIIQTEREQKAFPSFAATR